MSTQIPQNKDWQNKYDNSDLVMQREAKDVAVGYTNFDEMRAYREYLETLKLESEMLAGKDLFLYKAQKDGSFKADKVSPELLIPRPGEFELTRRNVLVRLNDKAVTSQDELKKLFAQFETDSVWELSGRITNYILDQKRKKTISDKYNVFA